MNTGQGSLQLPEEADEITFVVHTYCESTTPLTSKSRADYCSELTPCLEAQRKGLSKDRRHTQKSILDDLQAYFHGKKKKRKKGDYVTTRK